jgi:hypothetical protein
LMNFQEFSVKFLTTFFIRKFHPSFNGNFDEFPRIQCQILEDFFNGLIWPIMKWKIKDIFPIIICQIFTHFFYPLNKGVGGIEKYHPFLNENLYEIFKKNLQTF